ncbi:MAG: hypothetical protein SCH70_12830 [Candidatus Methanoperedens sp.]|nr:hypothetical protein [Candidatus Methanoperedens sp.]
MAGKLIIIELDEANCFDSCAVDEAMEKVQYLITEGYTSGTDPRWRIEDMIEQEQQASNRRRLTLLDFYYRMEKNLKDNDKDYILFVQCYDALAHKEGYDLSNIYHDDFNQAVMRYGTIPTILMTKED